MRNQDHDHFHFHFDGSIVINAGATDNSEVLDAIHAILEMLDHTAELQAQLDAAKADELAAIEALAAIAPEPTV